MNTHNESVPRTPFLWDSVPIAQPLLCPLSRVPPYIPPLSSQVLTLRDALAASKAALDAVTARLGAHDTELVALKARLERVEANKG